MGDMPPILPPDWPSDFFADQTAPPATLKVETDCIQGPDKEVWMPWDTIETVFRQVGAFLCEFGAPKWVQTFLGAICIIPLVVILPMCQIIAIVAPQVLGIGLTPLFKVLDTARRTLDPIAGQLSVDVLNELMGGKLTADNLDLGFTSGDHITRAQQIGSVFHTSLASEFVPSGGITPTSGQLAAQTFTGFVVNFGLATGVLGFLGGMVPFLKIDELREIPENVARNLGLGRLARRAIQPLIDICVATPYKQWLNLVYQPTHLSTAELFNPYTSTLLPPDLLSQELDYLGFATPLKNALVSLHRKRLTDQDLDAMGRYMQHARFDVTTFAQEQGYDPDTWLQKVAAMDMHRADAWLRTEISEMVTSYVQGQMTESEFDFAIQAMQLGPIETITLTALAHFRQQKHATHKHASLGEWQYAYENGLADLADLENFLTTQGYNPNDQQLLIDITLFKTKKLADAAAAKAARQAKSASTAAAKATTPPTTTPGTSTT